MSTLVDKARSLYKEAADFSIGNISRNARRMRRTAALKKRNALRGDPTYRYQAAQATAKKTGNVIARKARNKGLLAGAVLGGSAVALANKLKSSTENR